MRLLILGAGAVGGYFGARMAAAGSDVTFLVRAKRAEQLASRGLVVNSRYGDLALRPNMAVAVNEVFDVVLIACKSYDLESALPAIRPAIGPGTLVIPLLNGLRHLEILDAAYGREKVAGGSVHIGVTLGSGGEIQHLNGLHYLTFGPRWESQAEACRALQAEMKKSEFQAILSPKISQDLWEKFVYLTTYAGITCLMRSSIGAISKTRVGTAMARELLAECVAVSTASEFPPRDDFLKNCITKLTESNSTGTSSMLRDMQKGLRTEYEHILGDMLNRARASGIAAPILRMAYTSVQAYELVRAHTGEC